VSLPLFHAARRCLAIGDEELLSFMVDLPACDGGRQLTDFATASGLICRNMVTRRGGATSERDWLCKNVQNPGPHRRVAWPYRAKSMLSGAGFARKCS
jgi:hypothetical protein